MLNKRLLFSAFFLLRFYAKNFTQMINNFCFCHFEKIFVVQIDAAPSGLGVYSVTRQS